MLSHTEPSEVLSIGTVEKRARAFKNTLQLVPINSNFCQNCETFHSLPDLNILRSHYARHQKHNIRVTSWKLHFSSQVRGLLSAALWSHSPKNYPREQLLKTCDPFLTEMSFSAKFNSAVMVTNHRTINRAQQSFTWAMLKDGETFFDKTRAYWGLNNFKKESKMLKRFQRFLKDFLL